MTAADRPGPASTADRERPWRVGFDIGGTKILAGLVDAQGRVKHSLRRQARPELDAPALFAALVDHTDALLGQAKVAPSLVGAVGLGFPGDFDPASGALKTIPNLPRLAGSSPTQELTEHFARHWGHQPDVVADNDTVVAVLAEAGFGAGRGARRCLYLTVSTGVGGARFDGVQTTNLEPGLRLFPDPERPDTCLEDLAGGAALARRVRRQLAAFLERDGEPTVYTTYPRLRELADGNPLADWLPRLSARHLGVAAEAGATWARDLLDHAADQVARGVALLLAENWGEERIVVGGSIALHAPGYLDRLRRSLAQLQAEAPDGAPLRRFDCDQLVAAGLGEERGVLGAVLLTEPR